MKIMNGYELMCIMFYMPCHDHRFPNTKGPHTEYDYWLGALGNFSLMQREITLP